MPVVTAQMQAAVVVTAIAIVFAAEGLSLSGALHSEEC
jgi:thiol:disulfide interchange protein